ncbi:MAG: DUF1343 domain-containing protein [Myxococcales bacterium]|nr:DUF1343 domain-containing protein [Myxococcales bacterium]
MAVESGLDRVAAGDPEALGLLAGRRLGLLAHPASVDRRLRHATRVLSERGCCIEVLFGPEHGYGGEAQDMIAVGSESAQAGPAVYSLYGDSEEDLYPRAEWLSGLDAIVVDLQDVGSRYYTYVWTAVCVLERAAAAGVQTIVLDRPNPLGGEIVEGEAQRPGYRSFVGLRDVAVRHGMTIGEICSMAAREDGLAPDALTVVTMKGWRREMSWEASGLPWVLPSPNMPTPDTARVYPGGCLLEGTALSEGRGSTRPFEILGAPGVDGHALAAALPLEGATLRPLSFSPTFHKHARKRCGGVQVHVTDARRFRSYAAYLQILATLRQLAPEAMGWRQEAYEFVRDRPAIDLLTGGPEFREAVDAGEEIAPLLSREQAGAQAFAERRRRDLLYR